MVGKVRTIEKCGKCGGPFQSISHPMLKKEQIDLMCPTCKTRPVKVYIDGRGIKDRRGEVVGNLFKDDRGEPFYSFLSAHMVLSMIRQQLKDGRLDSRIWQASGLRKYEVSRLADEYVTALFRAGRSRNHIAQVENNLELLQKVTDRRDLRTVSGEDLLEMDKDLVKTCSGRTRKKYLQTVQAFIRWFNKYHLPHLQRIEVPPMPMIKVVRKEVGWIDAPEQETVLARIKYKNLHTAYRVLFATGSRIGEVCGLKKRDLIRNEGVPGIYVQRAVKQWGKVKETKTGAWMFKALPEDLFRELETGMARKFPEEFIWTTRYGNPYSPVRLSALWHRAAKEVGLSISLYAACRHSRATRKMIDLQKEMVSEVQRTLGHESPLMVLRHYIRPIGARRRVSNRVSNAPN